MASAIGTALISTILPPMAAKAMDIIRDKGLEIVRSMADKAMDNLERDISRLQTTLYTIEGIVQVAEEKQIDKQGKPVIFIQNWLRDLVDIGYEARDVLDDFITFSSCIITAYEEASNPVNTTSSLIMKYIGGSSSDTSNIPLAILNRLAKDIRSVRERFDDKKKEGKTIKKEGSESVKNRRPEFGASINKQSDYKFVEREEVKEGIMEKILHPEYDRVDVVAIQGMGGIGKTTLAQSIYNDERVVKKVPRSWLCVGESKFRAEKVIREILNEKETIGIGNLQTKLKEKLRGDRFLIVLDDVWDVDDSEWSLLFNPLTEVGKGGLIIITKREKEVCPELIKIQTAYDLKPLSEEDSWLIFESCAYKDGKSDSTPDLKDIGKEIVKKLNGLPLALRVVGGSLLDKDSSTWTNFLESNDWMLIDDDKDKDIMSVLRWSYNHLPSHIKTCFTYCALFPKDHVLDKKLVVQMWMAHDLIQKEKQKRPEDVGAQYFEKLVNASLLQCVDGKYVMHDLIHDLALHVSNGEFATANGSLSIDQMVRHITITRGDYSEIPRLRSSKKLLTLYTTRKQRYTTEKFHYSVLDDVFKQLKSIRVLVLDSREIKEIPDCISELRHLRYLDVSETGVKSLPDSLCRLYNLQMIAASLLTDLPRDIVNISSLRYIRTILSTCEGVGKLTSLQELFSIHVCEGDNIRELGDMQRLRGKLRINGLENVGKLEGDVGALMDKQTLMDKLELEFNQYLKKSTILANAHGYPPNLKCLNVESIISDEEVLDALGCPPNLTYLRIAGYNGLKPPSWMVDGKHKFDKLQTLELQNCRNLESLPALGELTSLKLLSLWEVGVKRLGDEFYGKFTGGKVFFPSLESLEFVYMRKWKEWDDIIIENSSVLVFPRLTRLELSHCNCLESLPPLGGFDKLQALKLSNCPEFKSLASHGGFDKLQTLELQNCPNLESLPALGELTSLKHILFENVGVKRLGDEFYGEFTDGKVFFPSLESLHFSKMQEWEKWDDIIIENSNVSFFPLLTRLDLSHCFKLESLPPLGGFDKLQTLKLSNCPKFKFLAPHGGFDKLQILELYDCPKLESLPPLGELTSLEGFSLQNVGVKRLGDEFYGKFTDGKVFFPSLESFCFHDMREWEEWSNIIIENSSLSFFPRLRRLELSACTKLESLPRHGGFDKLQTLELHSCPKLESLPPLGELTSLEHICLGNVGVKRLGDEFYGKFTDGKVFFPSLKSLEFVYIQKWKEWDDIIIENSNMSFFPCLRTLEIKHCGKLVSVLPVVKNPIMNAANFMTSLSRLEIINCRNLQSLPADGFPPSLRYLEINGCPLLYERCKDQSGLDWHKINHIPDKNISNKFIYPG